jgi:hypothetical protein
MVLVDAVSSVSMGQLKWQNDRRGQVSWQRADLRVTGQEGHFAIFAWTGHQVPCPVEGCEERGADVGFAM